MHMGLDCMARQLQRFRQGSATGGHNDLRCWNPVFDELLNRFLTLGHGKRGAFACRSKRSDTRAAFGKQVFAVLGKQGVVNAQVFIQRGEQCRPDAVKSSRFFK